MIVFVCVILFRKATVKGSLFVFKQKSIDNNTNAFLPFSQNTRIILLILILDYINA